MPPTQPSTVPSLARATRLRRSASNDSRTSSKASSRSGHASGQLAAKPSTNNAATWPIFASSSERRFTICMIAPDFFVPLFPAAYMLIEETGDGRIGHKTVGPLHQSMTFVLKAHICNGNIPPTQGRHDLLGFTNRHARVVGAMNDKKRGRDTLDGANG